VLLRRCAADYDDRLRPYLPQIEIPLALPEGSNALANAPPPVDLKLSHNVTVEP